MTFKQLDIAEPILMAVSEIGYEEPTPIQERTIPVIMRGKDVFGIARTGTGKTAAFAIPILQKLIEERSAAEEKPTGDAGRDEAVTERKFRKGRRHGKPKDNSVVKALILTPTRELASQIDDCFTDYGKYTGMRHAAIFGGVKQNAQTDILRRGVDILIATPGRLLDLMSQGEVDLDSITYFVLDEADRMLDMGFITDIKRLLQKLPKDRQTMFFSATMPDTIVSLSKSMLRNPERIEVTPVSSTVDSIEQSIYFVEKPDKKGLLISVLRKESDKSVLIFSRTKHGADNISRTLKKAGIDSGTIHGDKTQSQRIRTLADFKSGKMKVMVATDIAARGIDIKELQMVINYDIPDVAETYIHRIGRTGRAGCTGRALTFCSQDDHMMVKDIQKLTGKPINMVLYGA